MDKAVWKKLYSLQFRISLFFFFRTAVVSYWLQSASDGANHLAMNIIKIRFTSRLMRSSAMTHGPDYRNVCMKSL